MPPKPHKYRAIATVVDGIWFPSKKEANRWIELQLLKRAGSIKFLRRQPRYDLLVGNTKIGVYVADFEYLDNYELVPEDCKGVKTDLYKWKKKHFEAQYGIKIRET